MAVGGSHQGLDGLRTAAKYQGEAAQENDVEATLGGVAHKVGDGVAG